MLSRFLSVLLVGLLLLFAVAPALASGGVGGDAISVYVFSVDQAVAAISTEASLQNPTEALPAEAVTYLAVLTQAERGGVVLNDCTCLVAKMSGHSAPTNSLVPATKPGAPLHYWFMG